MDPELFGSLMNFLAALALFIGYWVLLYFMVWYRTRPRRDFCYEPLADADAPKVFLEFAASQRVEFEAAGYHFAGHFALKNYLEHVEILSALYLHPEQPDFEAMSVAYLLVRPQRPARLVFKSASFSARFAEGFMLSLSTLPSAYFVKGKVLILPYPGLKIPELKQRFDELIARHPGCRLPSERAQPADLCQRLGEAMRDALEEMIRQGYYRLEGEHYRLSWSGALDATLRAVPPVAMLYGRYKYRQAKAWAGKQATLKDASWANSL